MTNGNDNSARVDASALSMAAMALCGQPLMISAAGAQRLLRAVSMETPDVRVGSRELDAPRIRFDRSAGIYADDGEDDLRSYLNETGMLRSRGSLRVVRVNGMMMLRPNIFARVFLGAICWEEIAAAIRMGADAVLAGQASALVIELNTPGGTTAGSSEVTDAITRAREQGVRVAAIVNDDACSGGQLIASHCDATLATPSSRLGSIGTLQIALDTSKLYEKLGIRAVVLRTGPHKAVGGIDGDPYTDEQQEVMLETIERFNDQFIAAVARGSGVSEQAIRDLGGRILYASQAAQLGLCTLVSSAHEALETIEEEVSKASPR